MRSGGAVATAVVLLTLAACSGDDDAAATTTTPPPPTTSETTEPTDPTTTEVPPSTAAPTTSEPPATTIAETTVPPTTPDTTLDPDDSVAQRIAVVDAVEAASQAALEAVRNPMDDEKLADLGNYFTGVLLEGWQNVVADYRANNLRQIESAAEPDEFVIELASLALSDAGTFATVQGCEITSGVIVEVGGNPDGTDRVIEDGVARTVLEFEVVIEDGEWKVRDARVPNDSEQIASCD